MVHVHMYILSIGVLVLAASCLWLFLFDFTICPFITVLLFSVSVCNKEYIHIANKITMIHLESNTSERSSFIHVMTNAYRAIPVFT